MADDASPEAPLAPDDIAERSFPNAFRGFDPVEVRAFLGLVADEVRAMAEREAQLRQSYEELRGRSDTASAEEDVASAKEEADRLVREAMERVSQLSAAATTEADRVLSAARAEAAAINRTKNEEAESVAVKKIAEAERDAATIRVKAREDAEAVIEAAKERGREMIAEAQSARERMINDINKRKRAATAQLDQLRAGRDRLLETLRVVRRNLDEITTRLEIVEGGGRAPEAATPVPATGAGDAPTAAVAGPAVRPVRTSRVALGEVPAPAPGRASIDAPQARAAPPSAAPAANEPVPTPNAEAAPPQPEERKSSALRILRRHRPGQGRPAIDLPPPGRESTSEGVRIIRPEPQPEPEPEPEMGSEPQPEPEPSEVELVPEPVSGEAPEPQPGREPTVELHVGPETEPERGIRDVAPEELPPPLRPEELRPKIEDLFARIRAERGPASPVSAESAATAAPGPSSEAAEEEPRGPSSSSPQDDEHHLQQRDAVVEPLVGQLARRLKRAVQDEQNAGLDRLRTNRGRGGADVVLGAPATQPAPYRYAALPFLEEAARSATANAPFGPVAVGVDDLASGLAEELAAAIRARVERVLDEAAREDVDLATVSERISSVYREWRAQRVEQLATHHLVAAWSRGTFVATPEGTPLRWIVDDDGPCPDCDDNALAGSVPRGQPFPTGQLHPPAHPGCRCTIVTATVAAPTHR